MTHRLINRTERLAAIERMLLHSRLGLRAVEIAESCGVDRRTIYRDLSLLTETGVPIFQKDGRFFVNREYYLAPVRLSTNEAVALFLAARMFALHTEQPNPYMIAAVAKLDTALPEALADYASAVAAAARHAPVDRGFVMILDALIRAWSERRKVRLWYSSSHEAKAREFSTFCIEPSPSGALYAIGLDTLSQRIRAFNLRQVKRVKPLQTHYEIPSHGELLPYLANAWGIGHTSNEGQIRLVLLFSSDAAPRIRERTWHVSQHIEMLDDGRCKLSLILSSWRDMLPWLRSWGAEVEVLEPAVLREELAAEAARIAAVYSARATK